jgi:beta-glucosidase
MDQIVIGKLRDTSSPANGDCNNAGGNNDPLQTTCLQRTLIDYKTGSILSGGTDNPIDNTGHGWAEQYNTIQHYAVEHSRLHIPVIYGVDAVHGFGHPYQRRSSRSRSGWARRGTSTSRRPRAPRRASSCSRPAGTGTSRPSRISPGTTAGAATTRPGPRSRSSRPRSAPRTSAGIQGGGFDSPQVAATVKHFAGYSQSINGHDRVEAQLPIRYLQDIFMPAYAGGIDAGASTVMIDSGSINNIPATASHFLITEELRHRLGFKGVVISDYGDVPALQTTYHVAADFPGAIAKAVNAGIDVSMTPFDYVGWNNGLIQDVQNGIVLEAAHRRLGAADPAPEVPARAVRPPVRRPATARRGGRGQSRPREEGRRRVDHPAAQREQRVAARAVLEAGRDRPEHEPRQQPARRLERQLAGRLRPRQPRLLHGAAPVQIPPATTVLDGLEAADPERHGRPGQTRS